jgi:peptidoglycan hydrolase CwlO-like protein
MAEDNRRTQEELTSVYNELETAKQTIVDLQTRVEQRTRENNNCMELVTQLQKQIDERDAPKRGREPNEGNR